MGRGFERLKFVPGIILLLCGFVLTVVGVASTKWCQSSEKNTYIGLWDVCFTSSQNGFTSEMCYNFRDREYVPIVLFICSALCIVCAIMSFAATGLGLIALCQTRNKSYKWFKKAGILGILADILVVIAVCVYAGSYNGIEYNKIPRWSAPESLVLAWGYYCICAAAASFIIGATSLLALAINSSSSESDVAPMQHHGPSLLIHPPPSNRIMPPLRMLPRESDIAPLPFSQTSFSSPRVSNLPHSIGHF